MGDKGQFHSQNNVPELGPRTTDARNLRPDLVLSSLQMVVLGSTDASGNLWASPLFGPGGFARLGNASLTISVPKRYRDDDDPLWKNVGHNNQVAIRAMGHGGACHLGGEISSVDARGAEIVITRASAGAPPTRLDEISFEVGNPCLPVQSAAGLDLRGSVQIIARGADCAYVVCQSAVGPVISAFSGAAGFIGVTDQTTLRIDAPADPSFSNACASGPEAIAAGLCIADVGRKQILQLTGTMSVRPDANLAARSWDFRVGKWILRDIAQPLAPISAAPAAIASNMLRVGPD